MKNVNDTATDNTAIESSVAVNSDAENNTEKKGTKSKRKSVVKQQVELNDSDEIGVISFIPNVSYLDKHTQDMYEWDEAGHVEYMTFETLKDMWRNNKGYFRNLWLKPLDDRVISKFGLTNVFNNFEFLMEKSSYTKDNLENVITAISKIPTGMKFVIVNKIKQFITDEDITNVSIIKMLSRKLDTDFLELV